MTWQTAINCKWCHDFCSHTWI